MPAQRHPAASRGGDPVVAGIHVFLASSQLKGVDGRDKPTAVRHIFCLMERTALILFSSRRLRINWTRKVNAVRHQNSVFHSLLKLVSWNVFDGLVEEHGADELVRTFKTRHQFIALMSLGECRAHSNRRSIDRLAAPSPALERLTGEGRPPAVRNGHPA
jgi:hypothetical protein